MLVMDLIFLLEHLEADTCTYMKPLTLWMVLICSSMEMFSLAFWVTFSIEAVCPSHTTFLGSLVSSSPICH